VFLEPPNSNPRAPERAHKAACYLEVSPDEAALLFGALLRAFTTKLVRAVVVRWSLRVWLATSTNPVGDISFFGTRHLHAHARETISAAYLVCTAGAALFTCAQPLLLPSPSEGLVRWLKSRSTLRNTKGAHPNSHLHLIRVHRAVIETQKAAQNRLKKRRATLTIYHAVGSRHRDDVVRWNEAFCSLFSSVFFQSSTNSA
jgi:hypothetical protein